MKPDEKLMLALIAAERSVGYEGGPFATDLAVDRLGMHPKRAAGLLSKWTSKGWWNYGVSLRTGWLTDEGKEAAARVSSVAEQPASSGKDEAFDPLRALSNEGQG